MTFQGLTVCSTSIILTSQGHKAIITSVVMMAGDLRWRNVDLLDARTFYDFYVRQRAEVLVNLQSYAMAQTDDMS